MRISRLGALLYLVSGMGLISLSLSIFGERGKAPVITVWEEEHASGGQGKKNSALSAGFETGVAPDPDGEVPRDGAQGAGKTQPVFLICGDEKKGAVGGENLLSKTAQMNPHAEKGRVARLRVQSSALWRHWESGTRIGFPDFDGRILPAVVHLKRQEGSWLRVGGALLDGQGSFVLSTNFERVWGVVLFPRSREAWEIRTEPAGEVVMVQRRLESVLCVGGGMASGDGKDVPEAAAAAAEAGNGLYASQSIASGAQVPLINTRPGARGVVYLDFDGENVADPFWKSGQLIQARPSNLSVAEIREVIARVVEDFAPFDLTFTTDRALYEGTVRGRRMRLIVTPTTDANTLGYRVEGIAYVHSWSRAGDLQEPGNSGSGVFQSDIPAWVFDISRSANVVAEVVSHELGHTLGLSHDGQIADGKTVECYSGSEKDYGSAVWWAPIMGNPYRRHLTQWSKGEYLGANNMEDDLAIMAKAANGFGLIPAFSSEASPLPILCTEGTFQVSGVLRSAQTSHTYNFQTSGGSYSVVAGPVAPQWANVDVVLDLLDSRGRVLARSDLQESLAAELGGVLESGSYSFRVTAGGSGDPPAGGYDGGYSSYASLGAFKLGGKIDGFFQKPFFMPQTLQWSVGEFFSHSIPVAGAIRFEFADGVAPPWVSIDATTGRISGTPDTPGRWEVPVSAFNSYGSTTGTLQLIAEPPHRTLDSVLGGDLRLLMTTPQSPWSAVSMVRADGKTGWVAASGITTNAAASALRMIVPGFATAGEGAVLTFWCRTSTEFGGDFLECRVNGRLAFDARTSAPMRFSGEADWIFCSVPLPGRTALVELRYAKDSSLSEGQDRVWAYGFSVGRRPVVKMVPRTVRASSGGSFELSAEVLGADSMQWTRDSVALGEEGDSGAGSRAVSGVRTGTLSMRAVNVLDAGVYRLEAENAFGKTLGGSVRVRVDGAPQVELTSPPHRLLKTGDMLLLTARAGGSSPLVCVWRKDGRVIQSGPHATLQRNRIPVSAGGKYTLTVLNRAGSATAGEISVEVLPP